MSGHFEAKNFMYRKNKDGIIVGVVVHPNDVDPAFAALPIGARLMIAWSQIGDDEKPIANDEAANETPKPAMVEAAKLHEKMRKPFASLSLVQQCAMRCEDEEFIRFFDSTCDRRMDEPLVDAVRRYCGVKSRSEIVPGTRAAEKWRRLENDYQNWLTDQRHAESIRR